MKILIALTILTLSTVIMAEEKPPLVHIWTCGDTIEIKYNPDYYGIDSDKTIFAGVYLFGKLNGTEVIQEGVFVYFIYPMMRPYPDDPNVKRWHMRINASGVLHYFDDSEFEYGTYSNKPVYSKQCELEVQNK